MTNEPDSIVLRLLREIRADQHEMKEDIREIKVRMTNLEVGYGVLSGRIDRIERDVSLIKKRLDLVEA